MKIILKLGLILGTFILSAPLLAQSDTPFTAQQKMYVKGNSVLVGNTILSKHSKSAFNETRILNDQVSLNFVDIDEDDSTFSSSTASFTMPETTGKIKYAGLYWGGLYPAQSSTRRKGGRKMKYDYLGERDVNVQEVKLKVNEGSYQEIVGQIIYDSEAKGPFAKESPYACFADVTQQVTAQRGEVSITVANVRGTTGYIEGGAAAGWLLYVIYEDDTDTAKYFTSYSGFKEVSKEVVDVVFEGLQPKNESASSSKIMMAVLEGDTRIKGDGCAIFSEEKDLFISLATEGRPLNNFFNSTVSVGHNIPTSRTPASENTLGFDLIKMNVPDSTITASTKDAIIRLSTKQDRFYTFFLAFETEVEELVLNTQNLAAEKIEQINNPTTTVTTPIKKEEVEADKVDYSVEKEVIVTPTEVIEAVEKPADVKDANYKVDATTNQEQLTDALHKIEERAAIVSKGMIAGYYLVTNVFADRNNALNWKNKLNSEGYNARTFINEDNETIYVYIESSKKPEEMQARKQIVRQISHLNKTWVCRVNL